MVLSTEPGRTDYTPAWRLHRAAWKQQPSRLGSVAQLQAARRAGRLQVTRTDIVLNAAVVKWSSGAMPVDPQRTDYLGPGQLLEAPDTSAMTVTLKLHECFPGVRCIVTDTSMAPMAKGMHIVHSPRLQAISEAGATGRTNVFGNGVKGSGRWGSSQRSSAAAPTPRAHSSRSTARFRSWQPTPSRLSGGAGRRPSGSGQTQAMVATPSVSPAELRRLYEREQLVPAEIGERFGGSGRTVRAWLQDSRITLRSRPERRRRHPPPEPAELGRQYGADGLTTAELAARHGVSASTIRRWLQDAGVPRRPPGRQSQAPTADVLRWLYQVEGLSTTQIGVRYGVSQQAAHKWLRAAGVPLRPQSQPVRPRTGPANLLEDPHLDEPASW